MATKRKAAQAAAGSPPASKRILHVYPNDAELEDTVMLCAGGQRVVTTSFLLEMLSPTVLRGVVETARQQLPAGSSSSGTKKRLEVPCSSDCAEAWLRCLRLKHPAILTHTLPTASWAELSGMVQLADKYAMVSVLASCGNSMVEAMRSKSNGAPWDDADGLVDCIKVARRLNLKTLETVCWEAAEQLMSKVEVLGMPRYHAASSQTTDVGAEIAQKLAVKYLLREKRPDGSRGPKNSTADEDASIVITLLMTKLDAMHGQLRAYRGY